MQIYANPRTVYLGKCGANTWNFCKINASWLADYPDCILDYGWEGSQHSGKGQNWNGNETPKFKDVPSCVGCCYLCCYGSCHKDLYFVQFPRGIKWKRRRLQLCAAKWEQSKWILLEWQLKNGCYGFPEAPFHPCNAHLHFSCLKHVVSIVPGVVVLWLNKEVKVKRDFLLAHNECMGDWIYQLLYGWSSYIKALRRLLGW